MQKHLKPWSK